MLNRSHRITLILAVPLFAATAWLLPAENVLAQKKKLKAPQTLSNLQLAETITSLCAIKLTLEGADHDYGGHRAAAVRDVKAATHQLRLALDHVHKGKAVPKNTVKNVKGNNEPQALSDAQLAAAIPALVQTHTLLQQGNNDYGGHRARAVIDLGAAVTQLQTALAYAKAKGR